MQCIVAQINVKPECCEEYEIEFAKGAKTVQQNEQGCHLYQLAKDRKVKGKYYVLEVYSNNAAVQTHMKNLRKNKNPTMAKLMDASKKPVVTIMPIVGDPGLKLGEPKFAIVAVVPAKDLNGLESAIAPALNEVHTKEPGTLMYCLGRDEKRNAMVFLELYTDMAAIGTHGKTAYFKAMGKRQAPFVGGKPIISILQTCGNGGINPTQKM